MAAKWFIQLAVLWLENFTSESKKQVKTYFQGIVFRKGANKLKATEQNRTYASGTKENNKSNLLGSMIKFSNTCKCFLKCKVSFEHYKRTIHRHT